MKKLPAKINNYIKERFREAVIADVKAAKTKTGHLHYLVEVSDNQVSQHLKFDEKGNLLDRDVEANYPEDYEEGDFYGAPDDKII